MDISGIELSHLRYFVALGEELHFGRAALRLHIAQPPLTRQIQLLEQRLGCLLFVRTSRSTRLTPAGEVLLERARAIVTDAESAFRSMQSLGRGDEGMLTVATAPSLMLTGLPKAIRAYRKKYPKVEFRLLEMASSAILQAVESRSADLGLVRGEDAQAEIVTHLSWTEPMVAIVPHDHEMARSKRPNAGQLRQDPFVFFPRHLGPSFYDEVMTCCRNAGFVPAVTQEARQWSSIIGLVSAGMGVSIGPAAVSALLPKEVRYVRLPGAETTVRLVGGRGANPAAAHFLSVARRIYCDSH